MNREQLAHKIFNHYRDKLFKLLGRKALYDDEIEEIGSQLFRNKWGGCMLQSEVKPENGKYYIINTSWKGNGVHWCGMFVSNNTVYVYDSFGRKTSKLLPHLRTKMKIVDSDYSAEQKGNSEVCGVLSLAWLIVAKECGINIALHI